LLVYCYLADDNPYPVIDHDFLNDTLENIIQSDIYRNIDFLTGVTLNEGVYFAEYHIGHFYSDLNNQIAAKIRYPSNKNKRSIDSNTSRLIPPDITFIRGNNSHKDKDEINDNDDDNDDDDDDDDKRSKPVESKSEQKSQVEHILSYDPIIVLKKFAKLDYIKRYIKANFRHGECFLDEIKQRYEVPGRE
jgi:hypothetical protein